MMTKKRWYLREDFPAITNSVANKVFVHKFVLYKEKRWISLLPNPALHYTYSFLAPESCAVHKSGSAPDSVPEIIDPVFAKTSPKRSFSLSEYERFGLVLMKTRVYKFRHWFLVIPALLPVPKIGSQSQWIVLKFQHCSWYDPNLKSLPLYPSRSVPEIMDPVFAKTSPKR